MFRRGHIPVWIGIILVSGMFLLGQHAWQFLCTENADCASEEEFCGKAVGLCDEYGICVEKPDACPEILDPVCGCDGVTYDNSCFAAYVGVNVDYEGACKIEPRIGEYSNSGCLPQPNKETPQDQYPWCGGDDLVLSVEDTEIHILHQNATYNCCADDIGVSLEVEGNVLHLMETEIITNPCFCLCCYDVRSTIVDLFPGTYFVEYCWHDYEDEGTVCHLREVEIQ